MTSGTGTRKIILDRHSLGRGSGPDAIPQAMTAASLWNGPHCIRPRFLAPPPDVQLRADEIFGPALPVHRIARASLKHEGFSQVPQLERPEGSGGEGVFGGP